jgi:hypothetical protein
MARVVILEIECFYLNMNLNSWNLLDNRCLWRCIQNWASVDSLLELKQKSVTRRVGQEVTYFIEPAKQSTKLC